MVEAIIKNNPELLLGAIVKSRYYPAHECCDRNAKIIVVNQKVDDFELLIDYGEIGSGHTGGIDRYEMDLRSDSFFKTRNRGCWWIEPNDITNIKCQIKYYGYREDELI